MRLPSTLIIAALATAFAASPAQADSAPPASHEISDGVVVLIGVNDHGVVAPSATRAFTPPIGTDKGSVTAPTPTTPLGIIAILIG
jgi:hypothetical protein